MKKALLTGLAAIAAAGLGCASMPYNQRDIIEQEGSEFFYRDVTRTPEYLELAVRIIDNGVIKEEAVWTRYEQANSAECTKEIVHIFAPEDEYDFTWIDNGCDGSVDTVMGNELEYEEGNTEEIIAGVYSELFRTYRGWAVRRFDTTQQLADYHRWKGLE